MENSFIYFIEGEEKYGVISIYYFLFKNDSFPEKIFTKINFVK